ncbi:ATP-dependent DNA helicase YKU80 TDEL_0A02190 [Torulaspora delbrueckii]|uniref:ATP-dependent DNA helicase II subunit 2 n=1 Tax=Torulaspora delbrueckii TaxID=4950 RepID=G8ZLQ7_TORDE|nr:hypothetical protein TDEL_0A02190 [Torulaspora delbrueckii]CCE89551.1 hypothetical protein TDEL_0A02190 [Torulaspora delbrueckii]
MSAESNSFIVDVSPSMVHEGHLSKVLAYLEYTLLDKCKRRRKTDWVTIYMANCAHTNNSQSIPNVCQVQQFLAPVTSSETIESLRILRNYSKNVEDNTLPKNENGEADLEQFQSMVQCLLVASLDIREEFKSRKILRQIIIFTADIDGLDLDEEEIEILKEELNSRLILIDCRTKLKSDPNDEDFQKSKWGQLLKAIPGSMIFNIYDLLLETTLPKPNMVKPVRVFSGELRLGADIGTLGRVDDEKSVSSPDDKNCLCIKVEGYPATKPVSSLNRKLVLKDDTAQYEMVKTVIEYEVYDQKADKRVSVAPESIAKAYRYGSDYVVLPSTLDEQRFYRTTPGIDIRGFLERKRLPRYFLNSESRFILADTRSGSVADIVSFNVLVDSLSEQDKLIVARFVAKPNAEVQMCMMCPMLVNDEHGDKIRTLILNRLPFAEDERVASFPRLTVRTTTSGKELKDEQEGEKSRIDTLMSDYIDSLDMDSSANDEKDNATSYYLPLGQNVKDTTLPLPEDDDEKKRLQGSSPQRVPAIHLHRQKQVLLEWVHQKLISGSETFQIPEVPDVLREKISPHFNDMRDDKKLIELVKLLNIKENEKRSAATDEHFDEDEDEEANIPSLESILARGER